MNNTNVDIDKLTKRIGAICNKKNWDKNWSSGGCYIHLEVSEFIESLRGKGDTTPTEEAADVLMTLFAVMQNYKLKPSDAFKQLEVLVETMEEEEGLSR